MLALLNPEQQMFEETANRLARDLAVVNTADLKTVDRANAYRQLAENGLLALRMRIEGKPLASGVEVSLAAQALGGALVPAPFSASGVLAVELLALAGADEALIQALSEGTKRCGLLLKRDLSALADVADAESVVWDAEGAELAIGLDRSKGEGQLVLVKLDSGFEAVEAADLTRAMMKRTGAVSAEPVGSPLSDADMRKWLALALVTVSADLVGVLNGAYAGVLAYTKERVQYGVKIGSFQAVQHLCAEMLVDIEGGRDIVSYAAWAVDELDPDAALLAAREAKAFLSGIARPVSETVMQVYGGIGQTWEHIAHIYARRAQTDALVFGGADVQRDAIADALLGGH
ncbi:acyl-CoA dehydrogenase [Devosia sp. D6-9]|nr:acyl-CoA dehydrogenase [Devosia sp. D6-9]